jgi:predicted transcriptional regulator
MPLDPNRLRALRIESGLTVRRLQTLAGVPNPTIYRLESGDRGGDVAVGTVERISEALSRRLGRTVTVADLLTDPLPVRGPAGREPEAQAREPQG